VGTASGKTQGGVKKVQNVTRDKKKKKGKNGGAPQRLEKEDQKKGGGENGPRKKGGWYAITHGNLRCKAEVKGAHRKRIPLSTHRRDNERTMQLYIQSRGVRDKGNPQKILERNSMCVYRKA